jgi:hypothetical protein
LIDHAPWIVFEARDYVEGILNQQSRVFEYGSGGSTLFYSERVGQVVSVEHSLEWFNCVRDMLVQERITNCDLLLVSPELTGTCGGNPADPEAYRSAAEQYKSHSFRDYVASIDAFSDQSFALVAVDGRARPSCIWHARAKVKPGGCLLLDNSERARYQKAAELLSSWDGHQFYGPGPYRKYFWETTVWRKPET